MLNNNNAVDIVHITSQADGPSQLDCGDVCDSECSMADTYHDTGHTHRAKCSQHKCSRYGYNLSVLDDTHSIELI